jgi:hypothetical protein
MRHASHPLDRCPGLNPQMTRKVTVSVTAGRCRPTKEEFEGIAKNRIQMDMEVKTYTLRVERRAGAWYNIHSGPLHEDGTLAVGRGRTFGQDFQTVKLSILGARGDCQP